MALTLTKLATVTWDADTPTDQSYIDARNNLINTMVAEGLTDGTWTGNALVGSRPFIDSASAQQFITDIQVVNQGYRNLVSSSITDI